MGRFAKVVCAFALLAVPAVARASGAGPPGAGGAGGDRFAIERVVSRVDGDVDGAARAARAIRDLPDTVRTALLARAGDLAATAETLWDAVRHPEVRPWLLLVAAEGLARDAPGLAVVVAKAAVGEDAGGRAAVSLTARLLHEAGLTERAASEVEAALGQPWDRLTDLPGEVVARLLPQADPNAEVERAWLLLDMPATVQARAAFERVLPLLEAEGVDPRTRCWAWHGAGQGLLRKGDLVAAAEVLGLARERCAGHPETGQSVVRLARLAFSQGDAERLRQAVEWGRRDVPEWIARHGVLGLSVLLAATGAAKPVARRVAADMAARPWADTVAWRAMDAFHEQFRRGRWGRAAEVLAPLIAGGYRHWRPATWGQMRYWLGRVRLEQERTREAEDLFADVVSDHPTSWYGLMARARLEQLDPARAQGLAQTLAAQAAVAPEPIDLEEGGAAARRIRLLARWSLIEAMEAEARRAGLDRKPRWAAWVAGEMAHAGHPGRAARFAELSLAHYGSASAAEDASGLWRAAWPTPFRAAVEPASREHAVAPWFVWAVMRVESLFGTTAVSAAGARGLLQLMPSTATWLAERVGQVLEDGDLFDPSANVPLGVAFLRRLEERWASKPLMLVGYNAGPGRLRDHLRRDKERDVALFVEQLPWDEARNYVRSVVSSWATYELLYGCRCLVPVDRELPAPP